jgi:hypothetical protein
MAEPRVSRRMFAPDELPRSFAGAFGEPALLKKLADEEAEWVVLQEFQNRYLPPNFREERSNDKG